MYCSSCQYYQKTGRKFKSDKQILSVSTPFCNIGIDIAGTLPRIYSGNRYVPTVMDYGMCYPEAYAIPSLTTVVLAGALTELLIRVSLSDEIVSDQGACFFGEVRVSAGKH